jgi:hypothetical protein
LFPQSGRAPTFCQKSSRRGRLAPVLSHHRTYRSVYGGSPSLTNSGLREMFLRLVPTEGSALLRSPAYSPLLPQDRPFSGFLLSLPSVRTHRVHLWLDVRAFPGSPGTMPSADACRFNRASRHGLPVSLAYPAGLPGVRTLSFPPPTRHIYPRQPSVARTLLCSASLSNCRWPRMWFLFVGPEVCRWLPSDSASPQTPLP